MDHTDDPDGFVRLVEHPEWIHQCMASIKLNTSGGLDVTSA